MFKYTTAVDKIRKLKERKKIIQGGSSAGKTVAIMAILIDRAARNKKTSISVVSESIPHLKRGAIRDFQMIMEDTGRWVDEHWNSSMSKYTFSNKSYIEFFGADQSSKLRGARRDVLYINEANNITSEAYRQLAIRTFDDIYIDFNPTRRFWAHDLTNDDNSDYIILTYRDNEALNQNIIDEFQYAREKATKSDYWKNWVKVYIDGQIGALEGAVYTNWKSIKKVPPEARLLGIGLDFGYTNDPTAAVAVYKLDNDLILDELFYLTGLTNPDIANYLKKMGFDKTEIRCDSAEPKSIQELKNNGIRKALPAKTKEILFGISVVQQYDLLITQHSKNIEIELENYIWLKKDDQSVNIPVDRHNHAADAIRYLVVSKMSSGAPTNTPFRVGG